MGSGPEPKRGWLKVGEWSLPLMETFLGRQPGSGETVTLENWFQRELCFFQTPFSGLRP